MEQSQIIQGLERDLMPLLDHTKKPMFTVEKEISFLEQIRSELDQILGRAFNKPKTILESMSKFQFIIDFRMKDLNKSIFKD